MILSLHVQPIATLSHAVSNEYWKLRDKSSGAIDPFSSRDRYRQLPSYLPKTKKSPRVEGFWNWFTKDNAGAHLGENGQRRILNVIYTWSPSSWICHTITKRAKIICSQFPIIYSIMWHYLLSTQFELNRRAHQLEYTLRFIYNVI